MVEFNEETQMKQHHAQVWRALFVLLGMYVFFTVEQLMKIKAICGGVSYGGYLWWGDLWWPNYS